MFRQKQNHGWLRKSQTTLVGARYLFWNIVIDVAAHSAAREGDYSLYDFRERVNLKCRSMFIYVRSLIGSLP